MSNVLTAKMPPKILKNPVMPQLRVDNDLPAVQKTIFIKKDWRLNFSFRIFFS